MIILFLFDRQLGLRFYFDVALNDVGDLLLAHLLLLSDCAFLVASLAKLIQLIL